MSDPTPEQRKLITEEVIVYDPITQALTLEEGGKYKDYIENPDSLLRIAPRLGNLCELWDGVYMIAQIKLNQLGRRANMKRARGKCNKIIIIDKNPKSKDSQRITKD